jgi:hypothetical protein
MGETASAVEALGFQTAISEHLDDLSVFLALLFEDEFALLVVVLVLTPTSVLATLGTVSVELFSGREERIEGLRCAYATATATAYCGVERHRVERHGGAAPPRLFKSVRTFPLFLGILSSSCGCQRLLLGGVGGKWVFVGEEGALGAEFM